MHTVTGETHSGYPERWQIELRDAGSSPGRELYGAEYSLYGKYPRVRTSIYETQREEVGGRDVGRVYAHVHQNG